MEFFPRICSSDDDVDSQRSYDQEENLESQIRAYWFEVSDDDEVEVERSVFGKDGKLKKIQASIDCYDYDLSQELLPEAYSELKLLLEKVEAYKRKYRETPAIFITFVRDLTDPAEGMEKNTGEDSKGGTKVDCLKRLQSLISEAKITYAADEDVGETATAEFGEADIQDDSEEGVTTRLIDILNERKKADILIRISKKCRSMRYTALQISSLGCYCVALLDEEMGYIISQEKWESAFSAAKECFELLQANPNIILVTDISRLASSKNRVAAITDGLCGMFSRLQVRLLQVSQFKKCSAKDYFWVPMSENHLAELVDAALAYYNNNSRSGRNIAVSCCKILLALLGQRSQAAHEMLYSEKSKSIGGVISESIMETVKAIFKKIAETTGTSNEAVKLTAVCYIGYQYGLAGKFRQGCDALLRAGVPSYIESEECPLQLSILYNRVVAQLGLAAFVANEVQETYRLLGSLWENYNPSVLIGQGFPSNLTVEDEVKYRDNMVPHHLSIPYRHLELAAMLSALVVDTVNEAKKPYERSRVQRYFYRAINRRAQLVGSKPADLQDQVAVAYKALKLGDYIGAKRIVENMNAWKTLANGQEVLDNYVEHLKKAALRVFCFSNRTSFSTISVAQLALKYDMDEQTVRDVVNDMISDDDALVAYWDCDDSFLYIDRSNPTRLQYTVNGAADSVVDLAPFMERRSRVNESRGRGGRGGRGSRGGRGGRGGRGRGN